MKKAKKENFLGKILWAPLVPTPSASPPIADSTLSPSTRGPALPALPNPEIPVSEKGPDQRNATAVDSMMVGMAEKNLQPTPEQGSLEEKSSPKSILEEQTEHAKDLGLETNLTAKEPAEKPKSEEKDLGLEKNVTTKEPEDEEKEKKTEDAAVDNVNLLFPGLKKIGEVLGLSPKTPKPTKEEDSSKE